MSESRGVDARRSLPAGADRATRGPVRGGRRPGLAAAAAAAAVAVAAALGVVPIASGQGFEIPEPPSVGLPELPVPSPTIGGGPIDGPDADDVPPPTATQRRAPAAPESSRVDPPEGGEEPPSRTVGALVEDFEGDRVAFRQEASDAPIQMRVHDRTTEGAFDGTSERFRFVAGLGSGVYASYPVPKVPLSDELTATLYVRSERPGMQIIGRVVLPNDLDPETGQPFYVNVPGTLYEEAGRWRRLELRDLPTAVERQARILRIKTNQRVRMEGAYLDRIVLNLYGGAGETEVMVDALRVAPVAPELLAARPGAGVGFAAEGGADGAGVGFGPGPEGVEGASGGGRVRFVRNRLELRDEPQRAYFPWLPTIIDAPGASAEVLRRFGFDVYAVRPGASAEEVDRAVDAGMLLMPMLGDPELGPVDAAGLRRAIASFPRAEAVAFWHLGEGLGAEASAEDRRATLARVRAAVEAATDAPAGVSTLTTADVAGDLDLYTNRPGRLDLIGAHGRPWGSAMQPLHYWSYLNQRRDLAGLTNVEALFWTWIPASAPPEVQRAIYGSEPPPSWGRPQVLPEQIRMATAAALAAGYRGIGYRGDAELTRASGRARLIELQLLNAEIDLFQEILARHVGTIHTYRTYYPPRSEFGRPIEFNYNPGGVAREAEPSANQTVQAVGFSTPDRRGTLLLVTNLDWKAQWVPGQLAHKEVRVTVPGHTNVSAWEVTLGGIRHLDRQRVPGGVELRLTDFGVTSWILLTPDLELVRRLERSIASWAATAAELAIEQAELQRQAVLETHAQLVLDGFDVVGSQTLLSIADEQLRAARAGLSRGDAAAAFANARRVIRPLQILMHQHAKRALEDLERATRFAHDPDPPLLISPISAPPALCFNTLPQLDLFWTSTVRTYAFGRNLLPSGEFEETDPEAYVREGWRSVGDEVPGLETSIEIEPDPGPNGRGSARVLRLQVRPASDRDADELAPVQDRPTVAIETPPIAVRRHEFLRISVLVRTPMFQPMGSGGGVIVRDSIGGELMQFRSIDPIHEWSRVVLYRRAPEDGALRVTLGFAGTIGDASFDDLRIERAERPGDVWPPDAAAPEGAAAAGERIAIEPAPEAEAPSAPDPSRRASGVGDGAPRGRRRRRSARRRGRPTG